ncbi:MAG: hypothetical protein ACYC0W_00470 [Candidatus Nanopelagicales bacterium]
MGVTCPQGGIDPMNEPDLVRELVDATVLADWSADPDAQPADARDLTHHAFAAPPGSARCSGTSTIPTARRSGPTLN